MAFIQPCFIRKNTPDLRYKLSELGYTYSNCDNLDLDYIITFPSKGMYSIFADYHFKNEHFEKIWKIKYIDCGDNEELFLAIAALRYDTDKNQWFFSTGWIIGPENIPIPDKWIYCDQNTLEQFAFVNNSPNSYSREMWKKATVEEIVEHFKK